MTFINSKQNSFINLLISLAALIVGSYFLFSDGLAVDSSRSTKALWNLGHVVYFALLTIIVIKLPWLKKLNYLHLCLWILAGSSLIGFLIEALQYGTDREANLVDIAHDILGSLIVLVLYLPVSTQSNKSIILFKACVLLLSLISLWPLSIALWDEAHARTQFPILFNLSSPLEINRWVGKAHFSLNSDQKTEQNSLKVIFGTEQYSGVSLKYFNHDWSDYQNLQLAIFSANNKSIELTLRIHDKAHIQNYDYDDRFNKRLKIYPGMNKISIPLDKVQTASKQRLINLKQIIDISIFSIKYPKPKIVYINSVFLS